MKKINFTVPSGYVGISKKTGKVYNFGEYINPLTVTLKSRILKGSFELNSQFATRRPVTLKIEYTLTFAPKNEDSRELLRLSEEEFGKILNSNIAYYTDLYLSKVNPLDVDLKGTWEWNRAEEIIFQELQKYLEKEVTTNITRFFPFISNVSVTGGFL